MTALVLLSLAACVAGPAASSASSGRLTLGLGQHGAVGGISLTPLRIEEDSRCPADVQCIQAGTVRLAVRIEARAARRQTVLTLAKPSRLDSGAWLTLCAVIPHPVHPGPIRRSTYRFRFVLDRDAAAPTAPACG